MRVKGTVTEVNEKYAVVESERLSACEGCHKSSEGCSVCSLVGGNRIISVKAKNSLGACVGDIVEIETETKTVLFYAMLVFLLPVIIMISAYFLSGIFTEYELLRCVIAFGSFALTFLFLWIYSRFKVEKKYDADIVKILKSR